MSEGDESKREALYQELMPRVYNYFRYRLGNDQIAQDLTSCTFERAWRYRATYQADGAAFSSWLFTVARNVLSDHFSRGLSELPLDPVASSDNAAEAADSDRVLETLSLFDLLAELPARERELLALKYGCGLSNREISEITGLGESNVGTILHRTIRDLRRRWET